MSPIAAPDRRIGTTEPRAARTTAVGYAALAAIMLLTRLPTTDERLPAVTTVTQWLLAPTLAVGLALAHPRPRPRMLRWALVALAWCFLGDFLPSVVPGSVRFLAMVGAFLVAQLAWITAFAPWRRQALAGRRRWAVAAYVIVAVVLLAVCLPQTATLAVPVVGYAAALATMATLALGPNRWTATGGALFLVSDSLIALQTFTPAPLPISLELPIMATYAAALALLAWGVHRAAARSAG